VDKQYYEFGAGIGRKRKVKKEILELIFEFNPYQFNIDAMSIIYENRMSWLNFIYLCS
jgi:hypothetical protein